MDDYGFVTVWRCERTVIDWDSGGYYDEKKYAKTIQDKMILEDQGYHCTPIVEGL